MICSKIERILAAATVLLAGFSNCFAEDGVTASTITIGQSVELTGLTSQLGKDIRAGALAYFDQINSQGGIYGRKIFLQSLDDGYEPVQTVANTRKLIEENKVFGLFGYRGTSNITAILPIITTAQIPLIAPFTGTESFRNPFNKYLFHVRASYWEEIDYIVGQLTLLGMQKIAVFYQNDGFGKEGLAGVEQSMKKRNLKVVATGSVERNTVNVAGAVQTIAKTDPQAVIIIGTYKASAEFIRQMRKLGSTSQFMNLSGVGPTGLAKELGEIGRGVGVSQVVPYPWSAAIPVVKEFQKVMAHSKGEISFTSLEGYLAAKIIVEGIKRAGRNLTRAKFIAAMESMNNLDFNGYEISYSPTDHTGSKFVELTVIGKEGKYLH